MSDEMNEGESWQVRAQTAEAALDRLQAEARERLVRAELKAAAVQAGMIDLDGLKLLDLSKVELTEQGEIAEAKTLLGELKRAKPWLFGGVLSSSSTAATPPRPEPPRLRHANELSHEEWLSARAVLMRRR